MKNPKHLIFGAGLIGVYLAGCFIKRGADITLLARNKTMSALQSGISVSDYLGNHFTSPQTPKFHNVEFSGKENSSALNQTQYDVIWLTVKCTAVASIIDELQQVTQKNTVIICCQNGFGSELKLKEAFPDNLILSAVIGFNVAELPNAHWSRSTEGGLIIENTTQLPLSKALNTLNSDLLPLYLSDDINAERWAKLQLNLANAVNALADIPIKEMIANKGFRRIISGLMNEHLNVTSALHIELPKVTAVNAHFIPMIMRLPNWVFKLVAQKMLAVDPTARTSMWHDLTNKRKTEIDFINGAVSRQAKELGLASPLNDQIIELIKAVENGHEQLGFSAQSLRDRLSQ